LYSVTRPLKSDLQFYVRPVAGTLYCTCMPNSFSPNAVRDESDHLPSIISTSNLTSYPHLPAAAAAAAVPQTALEGVTLAAAHLQETRHRGNRPAAVVGTGSSAAGRLEEGRADRRAVGRAVLEAGARPVGRVRGAWAFLYRLELDGC
jgi:hypothetical protein